MQKLKWTIPSFINVQKKLRKLLLKLKFLPIRPLAFRGLWTHTNFLKLWAGQSISWIGSQITLVALPLVAALTLKATPTQMGFLTALETTSSVVVVLFAGVWVDSHRKRPLLIVTDIGRGLILLMIPIAALFHVLRIEFLYFVALIVGLLTAFFDVAYRSFLPMLVSRDQLNEGNSKLETSRSAIEIVGTGLAGVLVQLITAPLAILVDSFSFLASALFFRLIHIAEDKLQSRAIKNVWHDIRAGWVIVIHNPILRALAASYGFANLFYGAVQATFVLFISRDLQLSPVILGFIFAGSSVGLFLGALLANKVTEVFPLGLTILGAALLSSFGTIIIPLVSGPKILESLLLVGAQLFYGFGVAILSINLFSLRQAITPPTLQGRMNATMRFISAGALPIGAIAGGILGVWLGLRAILLIGAIGQLVGCMWLLFSPIRTLRTYEELETIPQLQEDPGSATLDGGRAQKSNES